MITKGMMDMLHEAIQKYDKKCGKSYLIAFMAGKKSELEFVQLRFNQSYFWHLLGCKLDDDTNEGKEDTYLSCKGRKDISGKVSSIHSFSEIEQKFSSFMKVFDFIENAKSIRIGYAENCPEQFIFHTGIGNTQGVVGYDYINQGVGEYLIPKSVQEKTISSITRNLKKIVFILSKKNSQTRYWKIEYEIKNGIYENLKTEIPVGICHGVDVSGTTDSELIAC